ncbi:MAG: hypothetical protein QF368_09085, partial [SAR202 cluster bacterium]|nr:hypothetical protein [SAR202 cluster bacterium]
MPTAPLMSRAEHASEDAGHFKTDRIGGQHALPGSARNFTDGEHGRNQAGADMPTATRQAVIEIERVGANAVGESGL